MQSIYSIKKNELIENNTTHNISDLLRYYSKINFQNSKSLKEIIVQYIKDNHIKINNKYRAINKPDNVIDSAYLYDIDLYFNKALYSLFASIRLLSGGFESLALENLYYCRFNLNLVLMRIQGIACIYYKNNLNLLVRKNWKNHQYSIIKSKANKKHKYQWEIVNQCYFNFQLDDRFSYTTNEMKPLFGEVFLGILRMNFGHLYDRNKILYNPNGFQEIEWDFDKIKSKMNKSVINYLNPEIFNRNINERSDRSEGLEFVTVGYLLIFTIELLREIQKVMGIKFIKIRKTYFDEVDIQDDFKNQIYKWLEKNNLS